jgi:STE24 endopeptidase
VIEYHVAFVALLVGTELFFSVLSVLNLRYGERTVRRERAWVEEFLGVDDVEELSDYHRLRTGLSLLESWVGLGILLLVLYSGLFREAVLAVEGLDLGPIASGVVFLVGGLLAVQVLSWPFDLVDTFVVDEIFGFNEQSFGLWVRDKLLGLVLTVAIAAVLSAILLFLVANVSLWWVAFWVVFVAFTLVMQVVYPRVIAPLFYDFDPVDGDLRAAVEDVFERAGFSCEQVYEMDASSRSSRSNAYFTGFGRTKRVVLFDTLIDAMSERQVQAVLAHELAHWKKAHVWKGVVAGALQMGAVLGVAGFLVDAGWLYELFGLPAGGVAAGTPGPTYAGVVLAVLWIGPVLRWSAPLQNRLSLKHEREADDFAADVVDGEAMTGALAALSRDNLANPFPHPWYETFHASHPPVPERIRRLTEDDVPTPDPGTESGEPA